MTKLSDNAKFALAQTVKKLRDEIDQVHKNGGYPADYSLGFANGLIFADHKMSGRQGDVQFYNRTTSIGRLPKPVALSREDFAQMLEVQARVMDGLIDAARGVIDGTKTTEELKIALTELDALMDEAKTKGESHDDKTGTQP